MQNADLETAGLHLPSFWTRGHDARGSCVGSFAQVWEVKPVRGGSSWHFAGRLNGKLCSQVALHQGAGARTLGPGLCSRFALRLHKPHILQRPLVQRVRESLIGLTLSAGMAVDDRQGGT